jgi:glutamyl-tRNA reductase
VSVLAVGLSHRTAPVALLEQVAVAGDSLAKLVTDLTAAEPVAECVVLSTCNRVEVYADVATFHGGVAEVSELLAQHAGLPIDVLTPHLYVHYEDRAVQHLFGVACGLDSMVVGETQVLGQVRLALRTAQELGSVSRSLNELFQQALRVGKRAHTETGIDRAGASLVSVGLGLSSAVTGPLAGRPALVVGAGAMSSVAATALHRLGAVVSVSSRTHKRAQRLADTVSGTAVPAVQLPAALAAADVIVSCTGAVGYVLEASALAAARSLRAASGESAPQFVLDLALPRDVEPAVRAIPGVTVVDLEDLRGVLQAGEQSADAEAVREIVTAEVRAFLLARRATQVTPAIVALRSMAADVVEVELARLATRRPELDERDRAEVAATVRRVVDKLLHAPTVRIKQLAEEAGDGDYAATLRELFDLDPKAVAAVTRADAAVEAGR